MIEVVAYDPSWADQFEELKRWYEPMLAEVDVIAIEHVGSTSIPGLAAKPIIDIDIVVSRQSVPHAIKAFEAQGHEFRGDLGIADRYAFFMAHPPFATNTYVVVEGSIALRNHLLLRETLRGSPELRREYAVVKRQLAIHASDLGEYVASKSAVIQKILKYGGMDEESLRAIGDQNK